MEKNYVKYYLSINTQLFISIIIVVLFLTLFQITDWNINIQTLFYQRSKGWLVDSNDPTARFFFYNLPKYILIICSSILLFYLLFLLKQNIKGNLFRIKKIAFLLTSIITITLLVSILKKLTKMHCPNSLDLFSGNMPYIKLFDFYARNYQFSGGNCFPAGHATVGFSMIPIAYILPRYQILSFILAILYGWILGFYQIAKGAHFVSDTIITMLLSCIVTLLLHKVFFLNKNSKNYL
jgi:membrane-associated PAP2 superfamily phosphatase